MPRRPKSCAPGSGDDSDTFIQGLRGQLQRLVTFTPMRFTLPLVDTASIQTRGEAREESLSDPLSVLSCRRPFLGLIIRCDSQLCKLSPYVIEVRQAQYMNVFQAPASLRPLSGLIR